MGLCRRVCVCACVCMYKSATVLGGECGDDRLMALVLSFTCSTCLQPLSQPDLPETGRGPGGGPQAWVGYCPWVTPPWLTSHCPTGTRESAFVYALSAAAISHAIARACTSGDLPGCSCGPVPGEPPGPGNRWGGCADNLSYGLLMGAKFSDAPMKVKKTGSQANKLMRLHNSEVGRQVTTHPRWLCLCQSARKGPPVCPNGEGGGREGGTGPDTPTLICSWPPPTLPSPASWDLPGSSSSRKSTGTWVGECWQRRKSIELGVRSSEFLWHLAL